jgi:hypothetical protein
MFYEYHKDGSLPENGEILVFGSNLQGRHGLGAAKVAVDKYGAVYGQYSGIMGCSYAIPAKYPLEPLNKKSKLGVLPVDKIAEYIENFKRYARENHNKVFFVTRIGCGLAGYPDNLIARLFRDSPINCNFADQWQAYLEPSLRVKP